MRWCPNGCGKCVSSLYTNHRIEKRYFCKRCKKYFTLKELEGIN